MDDIWLSGGGALYIESVNRALGKSWVKNETRQFDMNEEMMMVENKNGRRLNIHS